MNAKQNSTQTITTARDEEDDTDSNDDNPIRMCGVDFGQSCNKTNQTLVNTNINATPLTLLTGDAFDLILVHTSREKKPDFESILKLDVDDEEDKDSSTAAETTNAGNNTVDTEKDAINTENNTMNMDNSINLENSTTNMNNETAKPPAWACADAFVHFGSKSGLARQMGLDGLALFGGSSAVSRLAFGHSVVLEVGGQGLGSDNMHESGDDLDLKQDESGNLIPPISKTVPSQIRFPIQNGKIRLPGCLETQFSPDYMDGHNSDNYDDSQNFGSALLSKMKPVDCHDERALALIGSRLRPGRNDARYLLLNSRGAVIGMAPVNIFLWNDSDRIVVVDIDGTITKSNVQGVVDTVLKESYAHCHEGVCHFLSSLPTACNCRLVYLTSRPLSLCHSTRNFLQKLIQDEHSLPPGPLIGFRGSLAQVLYMELVSKTVHKFKHETIVSHILNPFSQVGADEKHVLMGAFGNTLMDMQAYHMAGLDLNLIYLIDKDSKIYCLDYQHQRELFERQNKRNTRDIALNDQDKAFAMTQARSGLVDDGYFRKSRGSLFQGYLDQKLLDHFIQSSQKNLVVAAEPLLNALSDQ